MPDLERDDIQGLIARGYPNLKAASYVLLQIDDALRARPWLADLATQVTPGPAKPDDNALNEYETFEKMRNGNAAETEARYKRWRSALAEKGPRGMWQAMLDEQRQSPSPIPYHTARLCARLGYTNEVFDWLNRAYRERDFEMARDLLIDDCWYPLRANTNFQAIVKRVGLKPK